MIKKWVLKNFQFTPGLGKSSKTMRELLTEFSRLPFQERKSAELIRVENLTMEIQRLEKELEEAKAHLHKDTLTGVMNRQALNEALKTYDIPKRIKGYDPILLLLDIDHFKRINDSYGHLMGDRALKHLANLLKSNFRRKSDSIFRYGGEEFIVILEDFEGKKLVPYLNKILTNIQNECCSLKDKKISMSASIGVAKRLGNEESTLWLDRADKALYQAKNNGRNRFIVDDLSIVDIITAS